MFPIPDLDFLVLNDLRHYKDFILEEEVPLFQPYQLADWLIYFLRLKKPDSILASCAFGFSKHHPFTKFILDNFRQAYQPHVYPCIGPGYTNEILKKNTFYYTYLIILALITKSARDFAKVDNVMKILPSSGINLIRSS